MTNTADLVVRLDDFDPAVRRSALASLARTRLAALPPAGSNVNMHCHSFFSYNAEGFSPSHLAWAAREHGLYAAGLCDFDVLDGLDEFLEACRTVALRAAVHIETRAFVREYAQADINSPGEPGVSYLMGAGFALAPEPGSPQAKGLAAYRDGARRRNEALIARIGPHLPDIAIDYERDVLPLTPAGVATERHIVRAFANKARLRFPELGVQTEFWAHVLRRDFEQTMALLSDIPAFEEAVRSRLAKRGGLGYEQPSPDTFPPVEEFFAWVTSCGAIPMATWLDGTSAGESDPDALLDCLRAKGAAAVNIVPDRNWNIRKPDERAAKIAKLREFVAAAERRQMPINIGTEMNRLGLPFVDELDGEALRPHKESFLLGARIMVGHSLLLRYAGVSYAGPDAATTWPDLSTRNTAFDRIGASPALTGPEARELEAMGRAKAFDRLMDRAKETA